jgi:ABC-2 type transport system permease protein
VLLVVIFGELPKFQVHKLSLGGLTEFDLYIPILICFVIGAMALWSLPVPLTTYREQGILRRLSTTPARPSWVLAAQVIVNMTVAIIGLLLVLAIGAAAFGETAPKSVGGLVLSVALAMAAVFSLGLTVAAVARTSGSSHAMSVALFVVMMFFAGLWVPRQQMAPALRDISNYTPLGAASQAIQDAVRGSFPGTEPLLTLAAYAIVFGVAAVRFFRWE